MKSIVAAVSFAILAMPAFAADRGAPFEQTQLDRGLLVETVSGASAPGTSGAADARAPYEQLRIDRGVPAYTLPHLHSGSDPVWAKDHNFIAPAL